MGVMSGSGTFDYGNMSPDESFQNRDIGLLKLKTAVEVMEEETPLKPNGWRVGIKWCVPIIVKWQITAILLGIIGGTMRVG